MYRKTKIKTIFISVLFFITTVINEKVCSQTVNIDLASSANVDFTFDNIQKITYGIVIPNAITFNIEAVGTQWDLYVGSVTTIAGTWDNAIYYTSTGNGLPPVSMLQMRVHNLSNTQQISGYFAVQDIAVSTLDLIGKHLVAPDPAVNCSDLVPTGTNVAGTYVTDPQCYQFKVDLKIVPGIIYRPGLYTLQIEYIIAEDL